MAKLMPTGRKPGTRAAVAASLRRMRLLARKPRTNALGREDEGDRTKPMTQGERSEYKLTKETVSHLPSLFSATVIFWRGTIDLDKITPSLLRLSL
jgi:hypothetical protein